MYPELVAVGGVVAHPASAQQTKNISINLNFMSLIPTVQLKT
jgi:hypothetical protein